MSRSPNLRKRSQWLDRLRRFARSKCSVADFCQREQVSVASFYQWRRKLSNTLTDRSDWSRIKALWWEPGGLILWYKSTNLRSVPGARHVRDASGHRRSSRTDAR